MPKRTFRIREGEPLLDVASYGRGGPRETGGRLTPVQLEQIQRTVRRTPEVVVKVLPRASNDFKAVGKHLDYIGRKGELELETDDGERPSGRIGKDHLDDWDLDLDDVRRQATLAATKGRQLPKIVHKLMFSMPPGTPPEKVLGAVRNFAREEFWGQHRYAFVLHTDELHPHVHLVLKAVNEQGVRLNIKKATLRHWRSEFARNLRLLCVEANATERAVRGESVSAKKDGIYRASRRGDSTYLRAQTEAVAAELLKGEIRITTGKETLLQTRSEVDRGWLSLAEVLRRNDLHTLAGNVRLFLARMPRVQTDRERIAEAFAERGKRTPLPPDRGNPDEHSPWRDLHR
jgi:hypothetical protein